MSYLNVDDNHAEPSPNARVPCMYIHRTKTADRLSHLLQLARLTMTTMELFRKGIAQYVGPPR